MKISVAICTYNGEKYIKEQIDSILNQSLKVDEIIVCDDCSTDMTTTILNQYATENPNLFQINCNDTNLRSVKNFEKAISLCSGDIIFLSDQDDVWAPNKVEKYNDYFKENKDIQVVASNGYHIDENSTVSDMYAIWDVPEFLREQKIDFNYFELISYISNIATGASMALKKEILPQVLPFPIVENIHHDEWIAMVSTNNNSFALLNEKFFYYRIHKNQQIGGVFFKKNEAVKKMLVHFYDIRHQDFSFLKYKKRLKKFITSYNKSKTMLHYDHNSNIPFGENVISIEKLILATQSKMKKKYPISTALLKLCDKALNKRQF